MPMPKWNTNGAPYMGERYPDYFVLYTHNRDSDNLQESNWRSFIKRLEERKIPYEIIRSTHWLCGWVESIIIHETTEPIQLQYCNELYDHYLDYPVVDEEDYSNLQFEKAEELCREIRSDIDNLEDNEPLLHWEHITRHMTDIQIIDVIIERGWVD